MLWRQKSKARNQESYWILTSGKPFCFKEFLKCLYTPGAPDRTVLQSLGAASYVVSYTFHKLWISKNYTYLTYFSCSHFWKLQHTSIVCVCVFTLLTLLLSGFNVNALQESNSMLEQIPRPPRFDCAVVIVLFCATSRWRRSSACHVCRYQEEFPAHISSRAHKHVTHSELVKLMEWKLTVRTSRTQTVDVTHLEHFPGRTWKAQWKIMLCVFQQWHLSQYRHFSIPCWFHCFPIVMAELENHTNRKQPYHKACGIDIDFTQSAAWLSSRLLICRGGSSDRDCSNWWPPTATTQWRNVPERLSASCLTCGQPSQSSVPWKVSALPLLQVSEKLQLRQIEPVANFLFAKCTVETAGAHCTLPQCNFL